MMAVGKAIIIAYQTARHRTESVCVSTIDRRLVIYIRQERVNRLLDSVCTAERPDESRLLQRIARFLDLMGNDVVLSVG